MGKTPRPKLPITRKATHYRVHYLSLERHITQVYRLRGVSILNMTGATHGLCPEYLIGGSVPPESRAAIVQIRKGGFCHDLSLVLAALCEDGDLPVGRCVIDTTRPESPLRAYKRLLQRTLDPLHPDCIALKERHRGDKHFRKQARIIDRSLVEWLKRQSEEPHRGL